MTLVVDTSGICPKTCTWRVLEILSRWSGFQAHERESMIMGSDAETYPAMAGVAHAPK